MNKYAKKRSAVLFVESCSVNIIGICLCRRQQDSSIDYTTYKLSIDLKRFFGWKINGAIIKQAKLVSKTNDTDEIEWSFGKVTLSGIDCHDNGGCAIYFP